MTITYLTDALSPAIDEVNKNLIEIAKHRFEILVAFYKNRLTRQQYLNANSLLDIAELASKRQRAVLRRRQQLHIVSE